jgi:hypothetical protein
MITHEEYLQLSRDSNGNAYYLQLLSLHWSAAGVEYAIKGLRSVASRLRSEPELWSTILGGEYSWRGTLLGCACLILSNERKYFKELIECFERRSFVSPQIAVTLGLLHPKESEPAFVALLRSQDFCRSAKDVVSAQRVLDRLGALGETDVQLTNWPGREQAEAKVANHMVIKHWAFWSSYINSAM